MFNLASTFHNELQTWPLARPPQSCRQTLKVIINCDSDGRADAPRRLCFVQFFHWRVACHVRLCASVGSLSATLTWLAFQMLMIQPPLKHVLEESCPALIRCIRAFLPVALVTGLGEGSSLHIWSGRKCDSARGWVCLLTTVRVGDAGGIYSVCRLAGTAGGGGRWVR